MRSLVDKVRVVVADDERRARSFITAMLRKFDDVDVVGEAVNGPEAVTLIESKRPHFALLDLHMPELDGFGVVRLLKKNRMPLVTFVTAFDEYAVRTFEANSLDYILKPVKAERLRHTVHRVKEALEREDYKSDETERIRAAAADYEDGKLLERIPVRRRDEIVLVPAGQLVSIVAEGEFLHLRTTQNENHTLCYRLRDLAARLEPTRFVRLGRGAIVNIDMIRRIVPVAGGMFTIVLTDNQEFRVSRIQSRVLRERLLRL
jgi:two-component system, LytTR family, response regulator